MPFSKWTFVFNALVGLTMTAFSTAAEPISLRAGPVTLIFDAENVFTRYIRVGSHEILRGINAPIRDQNWSTVAPKLSNLNVVNGGDNFRVTFDARCAKGDVDFRWHGSIVGNAKGVIEFTFDGEANSTFKRNRIGFCILHGPTVAGKPWTIETVDGNASEGQFPDFISPHQPAKNLRAITHEVAPGIRARVEFAGDVFEMEDQRNWTDASFKTYCTPLDIPYPVEVVQGTKVSQKVKISLAGDVAVAAEQKISTGDSEPILTLNKRESTLPKLGLQVSGEVDDLTDLELQRIKALRLDHLRVDLALSKESMIKDLRRATRQAKALGVSLHIGLNVGESPDFKILLDELKMLQPPVACWLVTGGGTGLQRAREQLMQVLGKSKLGITWTTNFVDLNRARPADKSIDAVGFAINPQIHAFDDASMVETLPIHADVVNSARQFAGNRSLVIGPITLAPQLVDGVDPPGGPPPGPFPTFVDVRQGTSFPAAWTLGSLKYLAEAGAYSATYFETVGWNGVMDIEDTASRPAGWPSQSGKVYPVYDLLKEMGEFAGGSVRQIDSSDTLAAVGLALCKPGRMRLLVANLKAEPQNIAIRGLSSKTVAVQLLGASNMNMLPELHVNLPPYGIARIDQTD
ncbi:MAG: hypothetical protein ABL921_07640 [Pirellula sp.]